jgi:hypothetical protein
MFNLKFRRARGIDRMRLRVGFVAGFDILARKDQVMLRQHKRSEPEKATARPRSVGPIKGKAC